MMTNSFRFVFFGTPDVAVASLDALAHADMTPVLIVTAPDTKQGRGMTLTPSRATQWGEAHNVPVCKPEKLSDAALISQLEATNADIFVVVAYGKILPKAILAIPKHGTLNMHPSLLPRHRGPSPIESQILSEKDAHAVGVSVMLIDEQMDHGPLLAQESVADALPEWPIAASHLRPLLAARGGKLLAETLPTYIDGSIHPIVQNDARATFCTMISKDDALLDLSGDPYTNYLKILAYDVWPRAYFFVEKNGKKIRVVVMKARFENDTLTIERVIPEGKKEMAYETFKN